MLKENPTKVEIGGTLFNAILVLDKPRGLPSRDPVKKCEWIYAHEWTIVGDALDNPEGGSFSTQTGTQYQAIDAKLGTPYYVKASDVVGIYAWPVPITTDDSDYIFNLSFVEETPEE